MKHSVSRDLHQYWNALRTGHAEPERGDIDPAAIRHVLAYTFILDIADPAAARARDVRFRLTGTRLNALFGRDLRGSGFDRIWTAGDRGIAQAVLDGVLDDRAAMVASARGAPPGYETIELELMLLPLRHHGRPRARILGSLASSDTPNWMGLSAAAPLDLVSFLSLPGRPDGEDTPQEAAGEGDGPPASARDAREFKPFRVYQGGRDGLSSHRPRPSWGPRNPLRFRGP